MGGLLNVTGPAAGVKGPSVSGTSPPGVTTHHANRQSNPNANPDWHFNIYKQIDPKEQTNYIDKHSTKKTYTPTH